MSARGDDIFSIADILDSQLETRDKKNIGRVADIEVMWSEDGPLHSQTLLQAHRRLLDALRGHCVPYFSVRSVIALSSVFPSKMLRSLDRRCTYIKKQ